MRWSQLKHRIESCVADPLRHRVRFHSTRYRRSHDQEGRGWITVDGVQVADMSTLRAWTEQHRMTARAFGYSPQAAWDDWGAVRESESYWDRWYELEEARRAAGYLTQWDFTGALWSYLSLAFDDALVSENFLIRALAMLDRRLGKRRFGASRPSPDEHPLVLAFHQLRGEVEGWLPVAEADA